MQRVSAVCKAKPRGQLRSCRGAPNRQCFSQQPYFTRGTADESALNGNGDGLNGVDEGDYLLWKSNFGMTSMAAGSGNLASASAVPEPGTCALVLMAVVAMCWRHRF